MVRFFSLTLFCFVFPFNPLAMAQAERDEKPIIIAHRGASGYLPEHTEGAKVLAYAQGADFIEQDVVLSRDGKFVVTHDIAMEETTDVAIRFPSRKRVDGKYYFADFDWAEIASLDVQERRSRKDQKQVFPNRFPGGFGQHLMRLEDEVHLIQGLNKTLHRNVGIYVELKAPEWHLKQFGYSMGEKLLPILEQLGYRNQSDRCFIQCFEAGELRRIQQLGSRLRRIQLMGGKGPTQSLGWGSIVEEIAEYADGIGPSLDLLVAPDTKSGLKSSGLAEAAHARKLLIHPYTFRADGLPAWGKETPELHRFLFYQLRVDGLFTDFPDVSLLERNRLDWSRKD